MIIASVIWVVDALPPISQVTVFPSLITWLVAEKIASYDEVQLIATTTGDHDVIARVFAENEKSLWRFINEKIKTIDGVKPQMDVSSFIDIFKMSHKIKFQV